MTLSHCHYPVTQRTAMVSKIFRSNIATRIATGRPAKSFPYRQSQTCQHQYARTIAFSASPSGAQKNYDADFMPDKLDALIVLAGGQTNYGTGLPEHVRNRLDFAYTAFQNQKNSGCKILCTGGGTPHKPPVLREGFVYHEGSNCADYLVSKGCQPSAVLKEASSYDTVGNGYFSLTIHAIPSAWKDIAVVTSEFHMPRSKAIFDHCYSLAEKSLAASGVKFRLHYASVPNVGIPDDVLEAAARAGGAEPAPLSAGRGVDEDARRVLRMDALGASLLRGRQAARVREAHDRGRQGPRVVLAAACLAPLILFRLSDCHAPMRPPALLLPTAAGAL
eukprot:CAMPEP_0177616530 /NCGR_PEP_ID=MMETSP0419_2-20121207/24219_1 /TAXON_ID=582737 /ORGANISM="Tetraselmis sp., Strain GSL018" /LENGTH=333 /DNA_ID=CAMNT_0019114623 /DNA_START=176 /DNA_END=1173 /DNA_ORIENTATION=-